MESNKPTKPTADEPMSDIHKLIGKTPLQVWEELEAEGIDPNEAVASMRALGRSLRAKYAAQIERERNLPPLLTLRLPIFTEPVAAGTPAWSSGESQSEHVSILDIINHGDSEGVFIARIDGWSMRDIGINDGDSVFVRTTGEASDGDVILAHIEGHGQVVKRLRIYADRVILESANPDYENIIVSNPMDLRIQGVVIGRCGLVS